MSNFRPIKRDTGFLLPPSVDEWLPQRHLARFVVEMIDGMDLSELEKAYRGSGSASYHPAMLLALLVYGYTTKVFSSRAIERATHDSWHFALLRGTSILTMTRLPPFASGLSVTSSRCLSRC
jgi:transposase